MLPRFSLERVFPQQERTTWAYGWRHLLSTIRLTPHRIAGAYLLLGLGALYVSDVLMVRYVSDPLLRQLQALKGGVEVIVTAGFIFMLARGRDVQLRQGIRDLDQQRTELQVLHRVIRHNLRNDLNVIQGYAGRIRDADSGDQSRSDLDAIDSTVEKMLRYTEQANRIRQISADNGTTREYDLPALVPSLLDAHPHVSPDVQVTTDLPDGVTVEGSPMFESALSELVTNAITHNTADTPQVSVSVHPEEGRFHMVEIWVEDNGPGLPKLEQETLGDGEEGKLSHSSGLGLWFVKLTAWHSNGKMRLERTDSGGTRVVLCMPMAPAMVLPSLERSLRRP